jgi:hypothetical protein
VQDTVSIWVDVAGRKGGGGGGGAGGGGGGGGPGPPGGGALAGESDAHVPIHTCHTCLCSRSVISQQQVVSWSTHHENVLASGSRDRKVFDPHNILFSSACVLCSPRQCT